MESKEPRILLWDIETTHNLAAVFRLFGEDYINHQNLVQERYVVSAAWKWLGEKEVYSISTPEFPKLYKKNPHDDKLVLTKLHEVLSSADVIVAHNGDKYDIKFTEARMLIQGLPPLPPIFKIDTLKVAKERFLFNSNKLDYLGEVLGVGRKKPTTEGLWMRVLQGDKTAVEEMVVYNKQDVLLLERVFLKLRPYMANHINRHLFSGATDISCPVCGSHHYEKRGYHYATTNKYPRFHCLDCGKWFRDKTGTKPTPQVRGL